MCPYFRARQSAKRTDKPTPLLQKLKTLQASTAGMRAAELAEHAGTEVSGMSDMDEIIREFLL
jgi:hypothetical protein